MKHRTISCVFQMKIKTKRYKTMKTKCNTMLLVLMAMIFSAPLMARSAQQSILEDKELDAFNELVLTGVFNLEIKSGDEYRLVIDADQDVLDYLTVTNKNGTLTISTKDEYKNQQATKIKLYLTCKNLDYIKIGGVGNVTSANVIKSEDMEIIISGVGRTSLELETKSLMAKVSAVGEVVFTGNANKATLNISGVGSFDASDFIVKDMFVTNSGIGNVQVHATEELDLTSSGIGGVTYYGDPERKNINNSGLGKVKQRK